jgi:hypothetical protein
MPPYSHCTVGYPRQAGADVSFLKLADIDLRGNGHMMMTEKNSDDIARSTLPMLVRACSLANQA